MYTNSMAKWIHRLSNIDLINKKADCLKCGRINIQKSPRMNHPRCYRGKYQGHFKLKYGIPIEDRPKECDICHGTKTISYDHCHKTGEFRGWLCASCNKMLGFAKDDPLLLEKAITYLRR